MQRISLLLVAFCSYVAMGQSPFFVSKQEFTKDELQVFYSSVAISGNRVFFIANDYKLYTYEKTSAEPIWCRPLGIKSTTPCFVAGGSVYAPHNDYKTKSTVRIDSATGKILKILPVESLQTTPVLKNGILYGTAIYDGGSVFAYDTNTDSLLWQKFIAHGVSTQPYYFPEYIQANAEADNWVRISYDGQYMDTVCKDKANIFVRDISCIKNFNALTHDGFELNQSFMESLFDRENIFVPTEKVFRGPKNSLVLHEDKLVILGNKKKMLDKLDLPTLLGDSVEIDYDAPTNVLHTSETSVRFLYNRRLFTYNLARKKIETIIDFSSWNPSQAVLDDNHLWLISKIDGRLYGFYI